MKMAFHRRFIDHALAIDPRYYDSIQSTLEDIAKLDFRKSGSRLKKLKNRGQIWSARVSNAGRILWSFYPTADGKLSIVVWDIGLDHDKIYSRIQTPVDPSEVRAARISDLLNPNSDDEQIISIEKGRIPLFAALDLTDFLRCGLPESLYYETFEYSQDELNRFAMKHENECYILMELQEEKLQLIGERLYRAVENRLNPLFWKNYHPRLCLDSKQEMYVDPFKTHGPMLITGPAGTGKTTIAFHRFLHHAMYLKQNRIMYITWSKDLANRIKSEFLKVVGEEKLKPNWAITDIQSFLESRMKKTDQHRNLTDRDILLLRLKQAAEELGLPSESRFDERKVSSEKAVYEIITRMKGISVRPAKWMEGNVNDEWAGILSTRRNQLYAIDDKQIEIILRVFKHYQTNIYRNFPNHLDYYDAIYLDLQMLKEPEYDAIIVDEVQDFTELELVYISKLVVNNRFLLMCGDPCQKRLMTNFAERGIEYYLRLVFKDNKVNLVVHDLTQNYRNTAQIFKISQLYFSYIRENYNIRLENDGNCRFSNRIGKKPLILSMENESLANRFSKARLIATALAAEGLATAVLVPDPGDLSGRSKMEFKNNCLKLESDFLRFKEENIANNKISIPCIYNLKDVAGLEFDAVIMLNCIQYSTIPMTDEVKRDYFRKIYVGLTRPRDEIVIIGAPQVAVNVFFDNEYCTQDTSRYKEVLLEKIFTDNSRNSNVSSIEALQNEMPDTERKEMLINILNDMRLNVDTLKFALRSYVNLKIISKGERHTILSRFVSPRFDFKSELRREAWILFFDKFPKSAQDQALMQLKESFSKLRRELIPFICDKLLTHSPSHVEFVWQTVEMEFQKTPFDSFHFEMIQVLVKNDSSDLIDFLETRLPPLPVGQPRLVNALVELIITKNLKRYLSDTVSRLIHSFVPSELSAILRMRLVRNSREFYEECMKQLVKLGKKHTNKAILDYVFNNVSDTTLDQCFELWSRIRQSMPKEDNDRTLNELRDVFFKKAGSLSRWKSKFHYYEFLIQNINKYWGVYHYLVKEFEFINKQEHGWEVEYPDQDFLRRTLFTWVPRIERAEHQENLARHLVRMMLRMGPILSVDEFLDLGAYYRSENSVEFMDYASRYSVAQFRKSKCYSLDWIGRNVKSRHFITRMFQLFEQDRTEWNSLDFKREYQSEREAEAIMKRFIDLVKVPHLLQLFMMLIERRQIVSKENS